jgi:DNA-binding MarR family transcriptional regulator
MSARPRQDDSAAAAALDLAGFLPYRLSVLANRLSSQLARLYAERFDLTIPEWRVMAVLGQFSDVTSDFVCAKTQMDRVTVSRAVARLAAKRQLSRRRAADDRRCSRLNLTAAGRRVYAGVVPLARRYEQALLAVLDAASAARLDALLTTLDARAQALASEDVPF